ncbi:ABC-three component system protein [Myroides odoratus]
MYTKDSQTDIEVVGSNNKVINGNNTEYYYNGNNNGKLSNLFLALKKQFETPLNQEDIKIFSERLKRYLNPKDPLGLEEKLKLQGKEHLYDEFSELKQIFSKKLYRYQNYEPAQEIFTFIMSLILTKYRTLIKPLIRENSTEKVILECISEKIVEPIVLIIESEGCNDIMGLDSEDIEGMYHLLTGNCHINWKL